ncbi:hypothetical protein GTV32_16330 [Gordonia sp. SID5947]|uniref:hypothetical protein n=1 Tax=Gordonia sp. SID5947 TaxID=2690315 RepID=UPI00136B9AE2|nr:hypothetical protein [Gordonia sp. SID5947]MYR07772.1 hypothetical protein [Gordonia sp. SID5947]
MYFPSREETAELSCTPSLVRAILPDPGFPGLVVKANSLVLKQILHTTQIKLSVFLISENRLAYAVKNTSGDPALDATVWSIAETGREVEALRQIHTKCTVDLYLFNELVVNVAQAKLSITRIWGEPPMVFDRCTIGTVDQFHLSEEIAEHLSAFDEGDRSSDLAVFDGAGSGDWSSPTIYLYGNQSASNPLSISSTDEGGQQEALCGWLLDNLLPTGAISNPTVVRGDESRELTDVMLTYEYGVVLIESKGLNILDKPTLPAISRLRRSTAKHVEKASRQLVGAVKQLRLGSSVRDSARVPVEIERPDTPHAIILVPDLFLLAGNSDYDAGYFVRMTQEINGFFHMLDPEELFSIVRAANRLVARRPEITRMMAFDFYLMERAKQSLTTSNPAFRVIFRDGDMV